MAQLPTHDDAFRQRPYDPRQAGRHWYSFANGLRSFDWRRAFQLYRRLLTGDLSVMREVALRPADNAASLIIMLLGLLSTGVGGWLYVVIDSRGAEIAGPALNVLLLGSIAFFGAMAIWISVSWHALRSLFDVSVDPMSLMRAFAVSGGFAIWQFWLFAGPVSFAVGLVGTLVSVVFAVIALRAAAPEADDRAALISVGIGFAAYALTMSIIAHLAGVGSGIFVHALN